MRRRFGHRLCKCKIPSYIRNFFYKLAELSEHVRVTDCTRFSVSIKAHCRTAIKSRLCADYKKPRHTSLQISTQADQQELRLIQGNLNNCRKPQELGSMVLPEGKVTSSAYTIEEIMKSNMHFEYIEQIIVPLSFLGYYLQ